VLKTILKRILQSIPTLLIVVTVTFVLTRMIPGNPARSILGPQASPDAIAELEEDIVTVDGLIAFAESEAGAKVFGANAGNVAEHAKEIKAAGAKYCDCPACAAVEAILSKKDEM